MFVVMHRHYDEVAHELTLEGLERPRSSRHTVLVLIGDVHRGVVRAVQYARTLAPTAVVRAVYVETDPVTDGAPRGEVGRWGLGVPLIVLDVARTARSCGRCSTISTRSSRVVTIR